jgi:hypothetical protein
MKIRGIRNTCSVFLIIFVLLSSYSFVVAQPQKESRNRLIHLQFSTTVSWNASQSSTPILPGETREVNITITYTVNRGAYGKFLLRLLDGRSFSIQLAIEEKPVWCDAWFVPVTLTGIVNPREIEIQNSSLFIHLNEDAPTNHTIGELKNRCSIDDMKGPFKIFTLIDGFEQAFALPVMTGP